MYKFETRQIHSGTVRNNEQTIAPPLYQTASFEFDSLEQGARRFALEEDGNIYTRLSNPTLTLFEERCAALEGGIAAVSFATGTAAISNTILALATQGDHIVASQKMYGGILVQFKYILKEFGISCTFVDIDTEDEIHQAIKENTKLIFIETLGNPETNVANIEDIATIAHAYHMPLIVDNTFATPYLCNPIQYGADIIIHSATKFLGGHGTTMGGVVIESGEFPYKTSRVSHRFENLENYSGLSLLESQKPLSTKLRITYLRDLGAVLSPFNAWLLVQGIETLSLRMERHVYNAIRIAEFLEVQPEIETVCYPSIPSNKYYKHAQRFMPLGAGSVFSVIFKNGKESAERVVNALKLFRITPNLGDVRSLVIHPASTTHAQLNDDELKRAGIHPGLVRISVGLEHSDDLLEDLKQAFLEA